MKSRRPVSELSAKLDHPAGETVQDLRLWKAFIKLSPPQRAEILALVELLGSNPAAAGNGRHGSGDAHDTL